MPIRIISGDSSTYIDDVSSGDKLLDILRKHNLLEEEVIVIDKANRKLLMGNERYAEGSDWEILLVLSRG